MGSDCNDQGHTWKYPTQRVCVANINYDMYRSKVMDNIKFQGQMADRELESQMVLKQFDTNHKNVMLRVSTAFQNNNLSGPFLGCFNKTKT